MRTLVTGHGEDRSALDAARRTVAYDSLILFTTKPTSPDLKALLANEALANVHTEVIPMGAHDFLGALASAGRVLSRAGVEQTFIHVAGGPNLVTSVLLLSSFEHGATAFYCHERGVSWLPVIKRATFIDRFTLSEAALLLKLNLGKVSNVPDLVDAILSDATVKSSLYKLRKNGLVEADAATAKLTKKGEYYKEHLAARGGAKVRGIVEPSDAIRKKPRLTSKAHGRVARDPPPHHPRKSRRVRP